MSEIFILDEEQNKSRKNENTLTNNSPLIERINQYLLSKQALKTKDKSLFFRLLSTTIDSWIMLSKSIQILEKQEKKWTVLKAILNRFIKELREWKWLSECLRLYPNSFSSAEVSIIESWEKTWKLKTSLSELSTQLEKIQSINGKLKSAMMYPAMVIVVMLSVIVIMMVVIVPKLLDIFDWATSLPLSTRILIWISDAFIKYWFFVLVLLIVLFIIFIIWKKTPSGKYYYDMFLLKIPIFWNINQKLILSKFSKILSSMLSSWVSIVESLRIVADAVDNEVYRQRLLFLRDDVKNWLKIHESLEWDPLFPEMMISMIQIWEQTAKIDEIILKISSFYDEEVDNTIWVINKLLEPIIIVTMAVVVWFIAIAIMQPVMNIADTIN